MSGPPSPSSSPSHPISQSKQIEFNDSVLDTKAWNSSRYEGRQLQGSKINEYTTGDTSYGNTPVIKNKGRTFYLATEIVSLSNTGSSIEDSSLQFIPDFSYILIDKAITVNEDDTLTQFTINNIPDNTEGAKKLTGFKREFQTNIPMQSNIGLVNYDASVRNRSNKNYSVYFNRGRLQPILRLISLDANSGVISHNLSNSTITLTNAASGNTTLKPINKNKKLFQQFFTGSFDEVSTKSQLSLNELAQISNNLIEDTTITGKVFATFLRSSGSEDNQDRDDFEPIRTIEDPAGYFPTNDMAELSTIEIVNTGVDGKVLVLDKKFLLNQDYTSGPTQSPNDFYSGSLEISLLNEEKPALLVNMNKEIELPDGKGSKPIVVVPENLHPFIKDNLTHFSAKAGLDIGDRKVVPDLDETNRFLK